MLNRIILIGRLTRDPELRYTPQGTPVAGFGLAVDRPRSGRDAERQTDFIDIVCWRQSAEFAANYLTKGRLVAIEGRLQIRDWVGQDGVKRRSAEVVADNVRPLDRPRTAEAGEPVATPAAEDSFDDIPADVPDAYDDPFVDE
ncbi:MAG: single-stranded DNA-binding protein [Armatimonadota bacterium]